MSIKKYGEIIPSVATKLRVECKDTFVEWPEIMLLSLFQLFNGMTFSYFDLKSVYLNTGCQILMFILLLPGVKLLRSEIFSVD